MSEELNPPKGEPAPPNKDLTTSKDPKTPKNKEPSDTFTIDVKGLTDGSETDVNKALVALAKENKQLKTQMKDLLDARETEQKKAILNQLETAGYSIKPFEKLGLDALHASAAALSDTDKELVVRFPKENEDIERPQNAEAEVWDHIKRKMVPFSELQYGITEEKEKK